MKRNRLDLLLSLAILLAGVGCGLLLEARWNLSSRLGYPSGPTDQCTAGQIPTVDADTPWQELPKIANPDGGKPVFIAGAPDAPLAVQVYLDLECPFSQQWIQAVLPKLLARKDVHLELHDFPLPNHSNAQMAAQAGRCAGGGYSYLDFLSALVSSGVPDEAAIRQAAAAAHLEVSRLLACLPTEESNVRLDLLSAQAAGVRATPTTVINGRGLAGLFPWATYERLLAEAQHGQ